MSAFMCLDRTIAGLSHYVYNHIASGYGPHEPKEMKQAYHTMDTDGFRVHIFRELFSMNVCAIVARYGDKDDDCAMPKDAEIRVLLNRASARNKHQMLKSMDCLLYQCREGDVPNTELFRFIDRLSNSLAHELVRATTEYSDAAWG